MRRKIIKQLIFASFLALSTFLFKTHAETWQRIDDDKEFYVIEPTPWGIIAGDYDTRYWFDPYNGLYFSTDLGETWVEFGLEHTEITDLYYDSGKIYAGTRQDGLYISYDQGNTWELIDNTDISLWCVKALGDTILIGGGSHGLWASFDGGASWEQKIGLNQDLYEIAVSPNLMMASASNLYTSGAYKSTDGGHTWERIPALENKRIKYMAIKENVVIASPDNAGTGIWRSTDYGQTWTVVPGWILNNGGAVIQHNGVFYLGSKKPTSYDQTIYKSYNDGLTWEDMEFYTPNNGYPNKDIDWIEADTLQLFVVTQSEGTFKTDVYPRAPETAPFLQIPWAETDPNIFVDSITSWFDHKYPLLGYGYHFEPSTASGKTMDYSGYEASAPDIYYSSHNGYDFGLRIGTEVKAPYSGKAVYDFCDDCGNMIKIDHENGYQTWYMHLLGDGLITNSYTVPVTVNAGDTIGKVGMTGLRTTGPHLHFSIIKDVDANNSFINDFPVGLSDPFGWQNTIAPDPWEIYTWTDVFGTHTGTRSSYLWDFDIPSFKLFVHAYEDAVAEINNKKVTFSANSVSKDFTLSVLPHFGVETMDFSEVLTYLPSSALIIELYDVLGVPIKEIDIPAEIEIDFSDTDLSNIVPESIKIYHWNEGFGIWEPLNTILLDLVSKKIISEAQDFSKFALFGEKIDFTAPETQIIITGQKNDEWYVEYPTVTLLATDDTSVDKTYYKLGNEIDWHEYVQPFVVESEGVQGIEFKSVDIYENWETTKDILLKVNTQGVWANTIKITEARFTIGNF